MSHRATAPSPPQLTLAYQDATWTTGAGQVLHVVGSNLSTSTEVDVSSFATATFQRQVLHILWSGNLHASPR